MPSVPQISEQAIAELGSLRNGILATLKEELDGVQSTPIWRRALSSMTNLEDGLKAPAAEGGEAGANQEYAWLAGAGGGDPREWSRTGGGALERRSGSGGGAVSSSNGGEKAAVVRSGSAPRSSLLEIRHAEGLPRPGSATTSSTPTIRATSPASPNQCGKHTSFHRLSMSPNGAVSPDMDLEVLSAKVAKLAGVSQNLRAELGEAAEHLDHAIYSGTMVRRIANFMPRDQLSDMIKLHPAIQGYSHGHWPQDNVFHGRLFWEEQQLLHERCNAAFT